MLISKMILYLSFVLLGTLVDLLVVTTCYLYFQMKTLLKMAEASINDLLPGVPCKILQSDVKRQKLTVCVLTGNSKQYLDLGEAYTEEQIDNLSAEEVDKLFSNYGAKLSGQVALDMASDMTREYLIKPKILQEHIKV